ncbi:MAG: sulfite exporter TauE/SafE family protein [Myxococcales bacterium]|nr:sulfite exporter TauE/SafE family protein [Myxococcales bacterium]
MIALAAGLLLLVGAVMGLLGGGGSILSVPVLTIVAAMPLDEAIFTSLVVVAVTGGLGAALRARRGQVRGVVAAMLGGSGIVGAYVGGRLSAYVPERWLLSAFAALMLFTALAMLWPTLRQRGAPPGDERGAAQQERPPRLWLFVPVGVSIGMLTGLVGVGGGFLIVPALLLLARLSVEVATGTSQLVICMQAASAIAAHASHARADVRLTAAFTALSVVGVIGGTAIAPRFAASTLRTFLGSLILLVAVLMTARAC